MQISRLQNCLLVLLAAGLIAGCSKETPAPVSDETVDEAAETAAAVADDATEAVAETAEETLEVVEESAADTAASDDQEIVLAQAQTPATNTTWKFKEGQHYQRLVPTQPTTGGADKIEVAEFFWYGCPHCYDLEPTINRWAADIPPGVRFVRIPAMWNDLVKLHAQLYYTEEVLVRNGKIDDAEGFRNAVFEEYHRRGNRLLNEQAIFKVFARFGVSQEDFDKTWRSFEVSQKLRIADDLARRYSISSVPAIVVNGKYRTGASEAGSYPKLIEVINELIARERAR